MVICDLEYLEVVYSETNVIGSGWSAGAYAGTYAYAYGQESYAATKTGTFTIVSYFSGSLY